ncbi:EKC/KEOPS complex subunit TPRKB-like [Rhopilema esculentum]|uniref:EKC/KEOPS complex subunit TPRKB-like n=1 Tax=Rhopilema esculentum TaxID=499914 RepID=UPI0031D5BC86
MAATECFRLGLEDSWRLKVRLFKNVKNVSELKKKVIGGDIQAALLRPSVVCHSFSLVVAANKARHQMIHGKMKTRTLHTELIFNLSPSHSISDSLKKFGVEDKDTSLLLAYLFDVEKEDKIESYVNEIDGESCSVDELPTFCNEEEIKKMYKVTDEELNIGTLAEAVAFRIAVKEAS